MAQRIQRFDVVSPAGSPLPSYTSDRTDFEPGVVTAITVEIPAGHVGKTGLQVWYGNAQLIPKGGTAWLKGNKKTIRYEFDDPHPGGIGWFVNHYNGGKRDHTFHFVIELDELTGLALLLPSVVLLRQSGEAAPGGDSGGVVPVPGGGGGGSDVSTV